MERDRDAAAGLLIAAAALLRAYPLLLLGYFLSFVADGALLAFATIGNRGRQILLTVAALGLTQVLSFAHGAIWLTDYSVVSRVDNLSLGPFVSRIFGR